MRLLFKWLLITIFFNCVGIQLGFAANSATSSENIHNRAGKQLAVKDFVFSPDGKIMYALIDNGRGTEIYKISIWPRPPVHLLKKISGLEGGSQLAINTNGEKLYVTNGDRKIYVINTFDFTFNKVLNFPACDFRDKMIVSNGIPGLIYIADWRSCHKGDTYINVLDSGRDEIIDRFRKNDSLHGFSNLAFSPDGQHLYATDKFFEDESVTPYIYGSLRKINLGDKTEAKGLVRDGISSFLGLAVSQPFNKVFVATDPFFPWRKESYLHILDATTNKILQTISFDKACIYDLISTPDGKRIYIKFAFDFGILDARTHTLRLPRATYMRCSDKRSLDVMHPGVGVYAGQMFISSNFSSISSIEIFDNGKDKYSGNFDIPTKIE